MNTCGHCGGIELARKRPPAQPRSTFGSPEDLIERGTDKLARQTERLGIAIARATHGLSSAKQINRAIRSVGKRYNRERLADPLERELVHGSMLGALDADFEARTNRPVAVPSFAALHAPILLAPYDKSTDPAFATRPVGEARRQFEHREPVTRPVYDAMTDAARRRAVTVANAATADVVRTVQRELARQVAEGADLRQFEREVVPRLEQAGWTPQNPSHAENVLRTNVSTAYNGGRARQMSQPTVLRFRPFWQIITVNDGPPRQRASHQAAHLVVLRADDPFWLTAYPPFGYQCRCRVRSLGQREGEPLVVSGSSVHDLPDRGFTSGLSQLDVPPPQMPPANDTMPPPANDTIPPQGSLARPADARSYEAILARSVKNVHVVGEDAQRLLPQVVKRLDEVGFSKLYADSGGQLAHLTLSDRPGNAFSDQSLIFDGCAGAHVRGPNGSGYLGVLTNRDLVASEIQGLDPRKFARDGRAIAYQVANHAKTLDEYVEIAATHEFGHAVHSADVGGADVNYKISHLVDAAKRADGDRIGLDDDAAFFTRYAAQSDGEYFAEAFAFYHYKPTELRRRSSIAFEMVEAVLKLRGLQ